MADWLDELPGLKDVQDTNNTTLARRAKIKIHGAGVTVADDPVNERVDVEIDAASATLAQVGDNPVDSDAGAAAIGSGTRGAKWDHKHRVLTGTPVAIGDALSAGTDSELARADHVHTVGFAQVNAAIAAADDDIDVNGQQITGLADPVDAQDAATKAYVDGEIPSVPAISASSPQPLGVAAAGATGDVSDAGHVHEHDDQAGGSLHAAAVAGGDNGFMTGADKAAFDAELTRTTLQTTDDTPTAVATHTPVDETIVFLKARVVALLADGSVGAGYEIAGTFRRDGGTTAQIGTTTVVASHEDGGAAAWDCDFNVSSPDVQVQVTGAAATTINWACMLSAVSGP